MLDSLRKTTFMEVFTLNIPPPPPAYTQTADTQKTAAQSGAFKDYFYTKSINVSDSTLLKKAGEYIEKNEKRVLKPYKDIYGKWTVGVGHLMSPEEVQKYANKTLTNQEVQELFDKDLQQKLNLAKKMFGNVFETYSDNLKVVILDGFFRGDLSGSPKTIQLLKAKEFKKASEEYLNNKEYRQSLTSKNKKGVAYRMQRNAKIMASEQ